VCELERQQFEGNTLPEFQIISPVYLAHAAATEETDDPIPRGEHLTGGEARQFERIEIRSMVPRSDGMRGGVVLVLVAQGTIHTGGAKVGSRWQAVGPCLFSQIQLTVLGLDTPTPSMPKSQQPAEGLSSNLCHTQIPDATMRLSASGHESLVHECSTVW
jgi:hypothetical protein